MRLFVLVALFACSTPASHGTGTGSSTPEPVPGSASGSAMPGSAAVTAPPAAPRTFRDELRGLLELASTKWPVTDRDIVEYLRPRAKAITTSNANLEHPPWATSVGSAKDIFVELGGEVAGVAVPFDSRDWGPYANLYGPSIAVEDIVAVVGPLKQTPRMHPGSPTTSIAYPTIGGHQLRVIVEELKGQVLVVMVHYEK